MTDPYQILEAYSSAGWPLPVPLPHRAKSFPPAGYTGTKGVEVQPSVAKAWADKGAYGNYALRLPGNVIGVDFDARKGGDLHEWVKPYTSRAPRSTSRGVDNPSGIYFLRIPDGMQDRLRDWMFAPYGTEIIREYHRYAVVWPSEHKDAPHNMYRWYTCDGDLLEGPPSIETLPFVPEDVLLLAMTKTASDRGSKAPVASVDRVSYASTSDIKPNTFKALLAGVSYYDEKPDADLVTAREEFLADRLERITSSLDDLISNSDPWEPTVGGLAIELYRLADAPWNSLTHDYATDLLLSHGPTCSKAIELGTHDHSGACWTIANLTARVQRSADQYDGRSLQLPVHLRTEESYHVSKGESIAEVAKEESKVAIDPVGPADDFDDFDDSGDFDEFSEMSTCSAKPRILWLTKQLDLDDPPEALCDGIIYSGVLNILAAPGGTGKSTIASLLSSELPGKTLWITSEEAQSSIHQRMLILDNENVAVFDREVTIADRDVIIEVLQQTPEIRNIVIDNLQAFFQLGEKSNLNNAVREALGSLYDFTKREKITIIGISHPPKGGASLVQGSNAWEEVARQVVSARTMFQSADGAFHLETTTEKDKRFTLLVVSKSNYARGGHTYWLVKTDLREVPKLTVSGAKTEDWRAQFCGHDLASKAYDAFLNDGKKGQQPKKEQMRSRMDEIDLDLLVKSPWCEPQFLTAALGLPFSRMQSALDVYGLRLQRSPSRRLARVRREKDYHIPELQGTYPRDRFLEVMEVEQIEHGMCLLSEHDIAYELESDNVTVNTFSSDDADSLTLTEILGAAGFDFGPDGEIR